MLKKVILFLIYLKLICFIFVSPVSSNFFKDRETAKKIVSELMKNSNGNLKNRCIAVVGQEYFDKAGDTKYNGSLNDLIIHRFIEIKSEYGLTILSRDKIKEILNEYKFQLTKLADKTDKVKRIGKALKADILIHGNISTSDEIIIVQAIDVKTHAVISSAKVEFKKNLKETFIDIIKNFTTEPKKNISKTDKSFNLSINVIPAVKGVVKIDNKEKPVERGNVSFYGMEPGKIFVEFIPHEAEYKIISKYYNVNQESYEIIIKPERLTLPQMIEVKNKIVKNKSDNLKNSSNLFLSTDKDSYKRGEYLRLTFKTDEDCYLYIINVDLSNTVTFLLPNEYCQDNFIEGGVLHRIPDESIYRFPIKAPYGKDRIYAFASKTKLGIDFDFEKYMYKSINANTRSVGVERVVSRSDFMASELIEYITYE